MPDFILHFIEGGNTNYSIRGKKDDNGTELWAVYDFINIVCGLRANNHHGQELFGLYLEHTEHCDELNSLDKLVVFKGIFIIYFVNVTY